jgi:hypothetical protein
MANIEQATPAITTEAYRAACVKMAMDIKPTIFASFAFNRSVTVSDAKAMLRKFHARLEHARLDRNWQKMEDKRSRYIATIEHTDTNLHIHAVFAVPGQDWHVFSQMADPAWSKLVPGGTTKFRIIGSVMSDVEYLLKDIAPDKADMLIIWNEY